MTVFEDTPLKIRDDQVIIHSGGSSDEVEAQIDRLLAQYKKWEEENVGKI